jgi:hypothetical protein
MMLKIRPLEGENHHKRQPFNGGLNAGWRALACTASFTVSAQKLASFIAEFPLRTTRAIFCIRR